MTIPRLPRCLVLETMVDKGTDCSPQIPDDEPNTYKAYSLTTFTKRWLGDTPKNHQWLSSLAQCHCLLWYLDISHFFFFLTNYFSRFIFRSSHVLIPKVNSSQTVSSLNRWSLLFIPFPLPGMYLYLYLYLPISPSRDVRILPSHSQLHSKQAYDWRLSDPLSRITAQAQTPRTRENATSALRGQIFGE